MLILEGLVGLHRSIQLQLIQYYAQCVDLEYCDIVWIFALKIAEKRREGKAHPKGNQS